MLKNDEKHWKIILLKNSFAVLYHRIVRCMFACGNLIKKDDKKQTSNVSNSVSNNFVIWLPWNLPIGFLRDNQDDDYKRDTGN